jgi:uncharacterized membrane protein (GlpM family)
MEKKKKILDKEFIVGALAIAFSLGFVLLDKKSLGLYPITVFSLFTVLGLISILSSFKRQESNAIARTNLKEIILLLLLFINPIVAKTIGFYVSGFVEIFLISILILPEKNKKSILKTAIFCLIAVIVAYLIFTVSLRIRCPRGVFNLF